MPETQVQQYGEFIGVSDIHFAIVTQDDANGYEADTPQFLAPAASVLQEPNSSQKIRYYDNRAYATTSTEGETKVTMVVSGVPTKIAAIILGKTYDEASLRYLDTGDIDAPWLALSFATDVDGGRKFYQYLKGRFSPYKEEAATRTNDIDEKTTALEYTAMTTTYSRFALPKKSGGTRPKPLKRIIGDTRLSPSLTNDTWFAEVQRLPDYEP